VARHALHLIDTPGHVDFTIEVERSMRVLDGAVLVIDAVMGVQAQSEAVFRQMKRHGVPFVVFVNKLDRPGADFLRAALDVKKKLGVPAIPVQYPLYDEDPGARAAASSGIVDLLDLKTWEFQHERKEAIARELRSPRRRATTSACCAPNCSRRSPRTTRRSCRRTSTASRSRATCSCARCASACSRARSCR
jgi:translation elongation factor EF-G